MTILVIDGQGGKLGKSLVESIKKAFPQTELMAIGTNSAAAEAMRPRRRGSDSDGGKSRSCGLPPCTDHRRSYRHRDC